MLLDVRPVVVVIRLRLASRWALRIIPSFYYGEFEAGDMRRDASVTVTGSKGDGNEALLSFTPGSKLDGELLLINGMRIV